MESSKTYAPFGTWQSTITPAWIGSGINISDLRWMGDYLIWLEQRSDRSALVCWHPIHGATDLTSAQSIRGGLFYGGGEFCCGRDEIFFVEKSGTLFRTSLVGADPTPVCAPIGKSASPTISPNQTQLLFVYTDGSVDGLALVDLKQSPSSAQILANNADFYMQPVWHPNGKQIAWVEWDHPQMSWQGSRLMTASLDEDHSGLVDCIQLAGGDTSPVFQPEYSPDGVWLSYIISDDNWDRLVIRQLASGEERTLVQGSTLMMPAWLQGARTYCWQPDSSGILYTVLDDGKAALYQISLADGRPLQVDLKPYTHFQSLALSADGSQIACVASSASLPPQIIIHANDSNQVVKLTRSETISADDLPESQPVSWETAAGTVHGVYFPARNAHFTSKGLPPALIHIHSGPTLQASASFSADTAFFTSRGYAVLSVNYRGSTGYGRKYRDALNGHWGEYDVDDAVSAADFLEASKLADPSRLVIKGSSAGGYTVLNSLIRYPGRFRAAICAYAVSNLWSILDETIKFEARYYDSLIGPLPDDEWKYNAWSPIKRAGEIKDPILIFQGENDPVVPISQAEEIVAELIKHQTPHVYRVYAGEGHGWRKSETLTDYYAEMERFLKTYLLAPA